MFIGIERKERRARADVSKSFPARKTAPGFSVRLLPVCILRTRRNAHANVLARHVTPVILATVSAATIFFFVASTDEIPRKRNRSPGLFLFAFGVNTRLETRSPAAAQRLRSPRRRIVLFLEASVYVRDRYNGPFG